MAKYISTGGATIIDSEEKLEALLKKKAKGFITGLAQNAAKRLRYNTAELVYRDYKPERYDRTMELLNSIVGPGYNGGSPTVNTGNGFQAEVGFDPERMNLYPPTKTEWGKHTMFDGSDGREFIIAGFESEGFTVQGRSKGAPIYERDPVYMIETTEDEIEEAISSVANYTYDTDDTGNGIIYRFMKGGD